jgi:hypothetical protein
MKSIEEKTPPAPLGTGNTCIIISKNAGERNNQQNKYARCVGQSFIQKETGNIVLKSAAGSFTTVSTMTSGPLTTEENMTIYGPLQGRVSSAESNSINNMAM